jgi:hypothetical protein
LRVEHIIEDEDLLTADHDEILRNPPPADAIPDRREPIVLLSKGIRNDPWQLSVVQRNYSKKGPG